MGNFHHKALMISASISAYTAPTLMGICLLTDHWIYGRQARLSQNPTLKPGDLRANFTYHRIGLWRECVKETENGPFACDLVKYSKAEAKLEKGFKAVSYRSAPSMACFIAASALLVLAIFLFSRGLCKRRRKAVFFISGLLFSISGLLTMVGVTLYVSITTEENVKMDQEFPVMESDYGFSFICAVMSFVLQELTGVLTVYWFIYRFRALVRKQEKLRERTRELMGNCLQMTTALPLNLAHLTNSASKSKENSSTPKAYADYHHQPLQNSSGNRTQNARIRYMIDPDPQRLKPPRRRIPFDANYKTVPPSQQSAHTATNYIIADKNFIPRSPSNFYGEYCRILIRQEDMALLTKMVKSKSQALLLNSPTPSTRKQILMPNDTNAIMCKSTSSPSTSQMKQQQQHNPTLPAQNTRRSLRKGVKRTTSV